MPEKFSPNETEKHIKTLTESNNPDQLTASAVALADSEDREATVALSRALASADFLNRLDDPSNPSADVRNLITVFQAVAEHPTEWSGQLCELLYASPDFTALPTRINFLLSAMAAVRPATESAAAIFRSTSQEGYAEVNGPLLLKNESPRALEVFEEIIRLDWVEAYVKIDLLHRALLPMRTSEPVLQSCVHLLESELAPEVREGLLETLFDYQSRYWFGPAMYPPEPPPWSSAGAPALQLLILIADRFAGQASERLQSRIQATKAELEALPGSHGV